MADAEYHRRYYHRQSQEWKTRKKELQKRRRRDLVDRVREYLSEHPCSECEEADIFVLDFDHIDRDNKHLAISDMLRLGYGLKRIMEEIGKCRVLCANCHRRHTRTQMGWY